MIGTDGFHLLFAHTTSISGIAAIREVSPKLLVSFHRIKAFRAHEIPKPEWTMLDSGAFSAWNSGGKIDIDALIIESKRPYWDEAIALDVIGDPKASLENALYMKAHGSPAYPVFHIGEPWEFLEEYCRRWPKVGLSCHLGEAKKESIAWLEQCFARHWPHLFHSFGYIARDALLAVPLHTADACSWNRAPASFGRWHGFDGARLSAKCNHACDYTIEIRHYQELEAYVRARWSKLWRKYDGPGKTSF